MGFFKYNTIDLDIHPNFINNGKEILKKITDFITSCELCIRIQIKDSNSKGYHILFFCKKECDICRLLFDDSKRFMMDYDRFKERQNVMFDAKYVELNET